MERENPGREAVLITGGSGYFGFRLGSALAKSKVDVTLFDVSKPTQEMPKGVKFVQGDICVIREVEEALQGMSCVFHIASYGMSGRDQLNPRRIEEVNVKGTNNIIESCRKVGISILIYTSTYNVVFGGQVIENGDESWPYLPLHLHPDHYSRTKALAEMKVLEANGTVLRDGQGILRTCAIRPAGIYGPGEQRHLPRIVNYIEQGWFRCMYGDPNSLVDFVHVDNLVQAHILAAEALGATKNHVAAGQAYFISDGRPVNNFEFFRPLVEGLGYTYPSLRLPLPLVYFFAFVIELIHVAVRRLYNFQPLLTRTEVYKTGVTHFFSLAKARRELDYKPQPYSLGEVVRWFRAHGHGRKFSKSSEKHSLRNGALVFLAAAMVLLWLLTFSWSSF
ncbi:short-chain dehydrogenase/reductase family 42E member 1 [Pseudonaja textilis]|uniref:Short chain dehydrogenase/reductase family 42E, member 1 n=1 Tax=Pseudonaja textilis TaxID=8673 RepID=A0A670YX36_PSETE|nr:short-chain dehydrogenase/reductase family 42E member 1 [Pseudonaja textilis]XP_026569815.1 short-chain dehydrogenase/reductase family 42E member 1 [Pseudonaja textilis]